MKDLKTLCKQYDRAKQRALYLDSLGRPTKYDLEEKERMIKESNDIMRSIIELRHSPGGSAVSYTIRSDFCGSSKNITEELLKRASLIRGCIRSAQQAEQAGDRSKANSMRNKANEHLSEMSKIRRSGHRTITTQSGLRTKGSNPVGALSKKRDTLKEWNVRQGKELDDIGKRLDKIEKRLNHIIEKSEQMEKPGDGSLQVKRPTGPVKR